MGELRLSPRSIAAGPLPPLGGFGGAALATRDGFLATWVVFFGLALTAMVAHSIEIVYHLVRGDNGEPWAYDFHFYGLQLLGAVLIWQGIRCLRAARLVSTGDPCAKHLVCRAALLSLGVAAPLIPIQALFGAISVLSAITVGGSVRRSG